MPGKKVLDYRGMKSPEPLFKIRELLVKAEEDTEYIIYLTDKQCCEVIPLYLQAMGYKVMEISEEDVNGEKTYIIKFTT